MNITKYKEHSLEMYYSDTTEYLTYNEKAPENFYIFLGLLRNKRYFGIVKAGFSVSEAAKAIGRNPGSVLDKRETQSLITGAMKNRLWNDFALPFGSMKIGSERLYGIPDNKRELQSVRQSHRQQIMGRIRAAMRIETKQVATDMGQLLLTFNEE